MSPDARPDKHTDLCDDLPAAAEAVSAERWPTQMAELADFAADELIRAGLSQPEARRLGGRVAVRLCQEVGGARYYWPMGTAMERAVRDLLLWADHDGTVNGPRGVMVLSRQYRMSEIQVRRILAAQRALHQRKG